MSVPLLRHDPSLTPAQLEEQSVHSVYESIAPHFSQTRHKPWPLIARFLHSLPAGTIGLDSGAGNGKYLPDAEGGGRRVAVALDRSQGLLEIARHAGRDGPKGKGRDGGEPEQVDEREYDCVRGDLGYTGWRQGVFDWTISVAAIHHLSTPTRRTHAVRALLQPLLLAQSPPYSKFLVYVWAYEQGERSRRKMGTRAPDVLDTGTHGEIGRGPDRGKEPRAPSDRHGVSSDDAQDADGSTSHGRKEQDVLVPWVLQRPSSSSTSSTPRPPPVDNPAPNTAPDSDSSTARDHSPQPQVFERYYHLFTAGELRQLVHDAAEEEGFVLLPNLAEKGEEANCTAPPQKVPEGRKWLRVCGEGWEMDNWWLEGEVGLG